MAREAARETARGQSGVTLSESDGVRYLHFGTEWVQGAMSLSHPYRLELEYQQQMMAPLLFVPRPEHVLQLGLGAAALTKFCYRHLRGSRITVVDIDPEVIQVARLWFSLPPDDERLRVVRADAGAFVGKVRAQADWLQVDLYDAAARGPVFDDVPFYRACRAALRGGGVAAFNLFGRSLQPSVEALSEAFGRRWLRLPRSAAGNTVVLAFAGPAGEPDAPLVWAVDELLSRARRFEARFGLPALDWLQGLRSATARPLALAAGARLCI
jgi:spermidine synthase